MAILKPGTRKTMRIAGEKYLIQIVEHIKPKVVVDKAPKKPQVEAFLEECCFSVEDERLPRDRAYDVYKIWCSERGIHTPYGKKLFYQRMRSYGYQEGRAHDGKWSFLDLQLKREWRCKILV